MRSLAPLFLLMWLLVMPFISDSSADEDSLPEEPDDGISGGMSAEGAGEDGDETHRGNARCQQASAACTGGGSPCFKQYKKAKAACGIKTPGKCPSKSAKCKEAAADFKKNNAATTFLGCSCPPQFPQCKAAQDFAKTAISCA